MKKGLLPFFFLLLTFVCPEAGAQNENSTDPSEVKSFLRFDSLSVKKENETLYQVILEGGISDDLRVRLKRVQLSEGEEDLNLKLSEVLVGLKAEKEHQDFEVVALEGSEKFKLEMMLPKGSVTLQFEMEIKEGGETALQELEITVDPFKEELALNKIRYWSEEELVEIEPADTEDLYSYFRSKKMGVFFGTGINYVSYKQEQMDVGSANIDFDSFRMPSFSLGYWYSRGDQWDIFAEFTQSPGKTSFSGNAHITESAYTWRTLSAQGFYTLESLNYFKLPRSYKGRVSFGTGLQYQLIPFLEREGPNVYGLVEKEILMWPIGLRFHTIKSGDWNFDFYFRVKFPLSYGELNLNSNLAFDGSVGALHHFGKEERYMWGVFWYGQYQSYSYKNVVDPPTAKHVRGTQSLLFSNLELRLGYLW